MSKPFDIVLVHPEIPQNTGNIGRTCVATGARLWLVRPLGFRMDEHHLQRAGLDYWQHLDMQIVDSWPELLQALDGRRLWMFSKFASRCYTTVEYARDDVLVFGSETQGLPDAVKSANADQLLRIPMREQVRSLNLATSVGIASYEALRQIER